MAGKIQNEDVKSEAELTGAGGAVSQLINDTKIYVTANSINKKLSTAITDGDIGGSPLTTKGDIFTYDTDDQRLAVGTNGYVLTADSAEATGLKWAPASGGSSPLTTKGDLFTYDTASQRLPVGDNDKVLVADSAEATGLKWVDLAYLNAQGGSAQVNYIKNSTATYGTTGWATYNDGTGATPIDGTGGTSNITLVSTNSTLIRGSKSFIASSVYGVPGDPIGSGVSYEFSIDAIDIENKYLQINFDYWTASNLSLVDSDLRVYVYHVDSSTLITPERPNGKTYHIPTTGGSSNPQRWEGRFKTIDVIGSSSTYRLIFHFAKSVTASDTLYLGFDNIYVGPELKVPYEVLESSSTSLASWGITASQWGDFTSLSLTPGTWDLSGVLWLHNNGSVTAGDYYLGTGSTSGNTAPSGGTPVDSTVATNEANSGYYSYLAFSNVMKEVTTTTTYYLKAKYDASVTNIRRAYRFTARRVR